MKEWTTACPDWEERIVAGRSLIPCEPLFPDEAEDALQYFDGLRMVDATGSPTMGEVCRPWVREFVAAIFGAYDPHAGRRLITEAMLLIAKKNGKSTIAAGIMMTALLRNWRKSGEFIILAPTVEIANNSFYPARDMARADDELKALLHVQDHYRTITNRETGATLKVVAADSDTVGGKKAIGVLVDELWLFGKQPKAASMLLEATGGMASRPEGFTVYLSTHSDEAPSGVFLDKLNFARGVRDGRIDAKHFLPVLYEWPKAMREASAYRDLANAYITNPNLGASVDPPFLERKLQEAEAAGEHAVRVFLAKHLNVEIGLALMSDRWAGADYWQAAGNPELTLDNVLSRSEVVVVGIDGGGLDDLLGLAVLGRDTSTRQWLLWAHAWAHRIVLDRRKSIAPQLLDFARDGDLTLVDKPGHDVQQVADIICRINGMGLLPEDKAIGVDAAGIGDILDELTAPARKLKAEQVIGISQGWRMNGAIKTTERKLAGGELVHCGRPFMAWCVGNAKTEPKGNAVAITKQAAGTAKIDPLMAVFDAVSLMALNPAPTRKKYQLLFV